MHYSSQHSQPDTGEAAKWALEGQPNPSRFHYISELTSERQALVVATLYKSSREQ